MKTRTQKLNLSKTWLAIGIVVIVAVVAFGFWTLTKHNAKKSTSATSSSATASATPTPSPGSPGNPGDQEKSQLGSNTPAPTSTPATGSQTINISFFAVTPQGGGVVRVQDQLTGTTAGTCTLKMTSPKGDQNQTVSGAIGFSGTDYFCSFSTISGVTELGNWAATLSVDSGPDTSNVATTTFNVVSN